MISLRQLFLLNNAQTSSTPRLLQIERAEGVYLYDEQDQPYLDLVSGFAVSNIGHRHPKVVQAVKDQLDRYMHLTVYGEFVQSPQVQLAQRLISLLPQTLNSVYLVNSGTEAVEGALKLVKRYTGRTKIIAYHQAYHGSTHGALSVMGNEYYKQSYRPLLPDIHFIRFNEREDLQLIDQNTACVIMETIQGEAGVRVPDHFYMQALRERCNEVGALLILDEIQTGFGRTGTLFAFEHFGIVPDVLLLAKAMGGGMPIGAFIASKSLMDCLKENPILGHITTFGGHPVCCASALTALDVLLEEQLIHQVEAKEKLFRELLVHSQIKEIRGKGLMLAIELSDFDKVKTVSQSCIDHGLIVDWFLHCDTSLRIAPPLTITIDEIKKACYTIIKGLD